MTFITKLTTFRATPAVLASLVALFLSSAATAQDPVGANAQQNVVKVAQRGVVRSLLGVRDNEAGTRDARLAPSYNASANNANTTERQSARATRRNSDAIPQGTVRMRSNNAEQQAKDTAPAFTPVSMTRTADAQDEPLPTLDIVEEPAVVEEQQVPGDGEDDRVLEEMQQAAAEAQGADVPAEVKTRALANVDEDAPDAKVRLTDLDVTEEAIAEHTQDEPQTAVEIPEPKTIASNAPRQTKPVLGFADSARAVRDMSSDLVEQLKAHGGSELYARWRAYNASIRSRTNSLQTGNELNNRARLQWYEKLYQDPLNSVNEAEAVSRAWAEEFMGSADDVIEGVRNARAHMGVSVRGERPKRKAVASSNDALDQLKAVLVEAASLHAKAVAPCSKNDLAAVMNEAYSIFCGQVQSGHTIPSRGRGQYLIDAMEKMNKAALYEAGEAVLSLIDEDMKAALANIDFNSLEKTKIGDNQIVGLISTEAGDILIGDSNRTVWDLDKYPKACCIIDLGGNDVYREGACVLARPLLVVIDLGKGNDEYTGKNYAIQAGTVLGVTMWYDDGGNDYYLAKDICQGSAIGGFAALINEEGNDRYVGFRRAQGAALGGFGLLLDRAGKDDYRAALLAQGFGAPGGFGAIVDKSGDDHYYVGGYFFDSYPEHPGYDGWGQGIGAGIRRCACGGIGVLLDGAGDDAYECDYFGHGGGYWMGVGIARDFGGNDMRYSATSTMYDGSRRREQRWTRFTNGFGCHYAVGYCFDDLGDDVYGGTIMGLGMGWDLGSGFLVDFDGNDSFEATGGLTQGAGGEGSIGVIMNYRGNDTYLGNYQGYASGQLSYHAPSNCGANFSFVVDHGGKDVYGGVGNDRRPIQNNAITVRGYSTGLVIDRPSPTEEKDTANAAAATGKAQIASSGMSAKEGQVRTMVEPPPLYDTNPHPTSSGTNAFNPQPESGGFGGGWGNGGGLFGRGGLF